MALRLAKLSRPRASRVHPRAGLFRRLDRAVRERVTWITGPPGSGKTALAASWLSERRLPHLWVQLDAGDSDVATFFHYLSLGAERIVRPGSILPRFSPESLEAPDLFARRWFRDLCAAAATPAALVLDDYHEIRKDSPLHGALARGLAELPSQVAPLILGREEPPPAFARLRASEVLEVVGGEELTLSLAEARAIARLREVDEGVLRRVPELHERSAGWAAGFLLLISGAGGRGSRAALRPGRQPHRVIMDYFDQEVLARADATGRRTLLAASLMSRVTSTAAVRLTGHAGAAAQLDDLARRSYFTSRDETLQPTYRFHDLFRTFLRERAEAEIPPEELRALRASAAAILADEGRLEEAVEMAFGAGDEEFAGKLFLAMAPGLVHGGRLETALQWAGRFSEARRRDDPALLYWSGVAGVAVAAPGSHAALSRAFELFQAAGDGRGAWLAWASLVEAHTWGMSDVEPIDPLLDQLDELLARFPFPDAEVRARVVASAILGLVHRQPAHPRLAEWEKEAMDLALSPLPPALRVRVAVPLLLFHGWWATDLARGGVIADSLRPLVEGPRADPVLGVLWHAMAANMRLHAGEAGGAWEEAGRGLDLARSIGLRRWEPLLQMTRALAALRDQDDPGADAALRELGDLGEDAPGLHRCIYHQVSGIAALMRGRPAAAVDHGRAALRNAAGVPFAEGACRITLALALSRRRAGGDLGALREALELSRANRHVQGHVAGALALASEALRVGDAAACLEALREGLEVAGRIGYRTHPWLRREDLAALCALALEHGVMPEVVREIIAVNGLAPAGPARFLDAWPRRLRITALGSLAIERDGASLATSGRAHRRALALLGLLVAHGPRGARTEALADALWPEAEADAARGALDTLAWRLRKLLGEPHAVVQREGRLLIDPALAFVDAWAVEHLAEAAPADGAPGGRLGSDARARHVRRLSAGELLPGDDSPVVTAVRERIRAKVERLLALG